MIIAMDGSFLLTDIKRSNTYSRTAVYVSGDFSGASAHLAYHNKSGDPIALLDGTLTSGEQYLVHDGVERLISVIVTGATDTTLIDIETHGVA